MGPQDIITLIQQTILVSLQVSAPLLIIILLVGFFLSILMSVTQISETTLIFIPKLIAFCITFAICFPWMLKILIRFTNEVLINQWDNVIAFSNYAS